MSNKKNIGVISHYWSCNFGDKFQAYHIIDKLQKYSDKLNIIKINFSSTGIKTMDGCNPDYILNNVELDYVILFTGSIGCNSAYNSMMNTLMNKNHVKKIFVIGGFSSDLLHQDIINLKYLFSEKTIFLLERILNSICTIKVVFYENNFDCAIF